LSADEYRERFGLNRSTPLADADYLEKQRRHAWTMGLAQLGIPITPERRRHDPRFRRPSRPYRLEGRERLRWAKMGASYTPPHPAPDLPSLWGRL